MERVEFELKEALARHEPPADFTARVMRQVRAAPRPSSGPWRWLAAGAMAASLSLGFFVYSERETLADQRAEADLILSLQTAGVKISQARDAVLRPRELQP
ncbi:MAG: hypothetical protein O2968_14380 [Acidobacteria bacterium]|nr:hypothetical protein [Acidobacteriota bacterium]